MSPPRQLQRLRPADWFWVAAAALLVIAVGYNVFVAEDGDTLSEAVDGYIERWPWLKPAILIVARHLANDLDPRADPIGIGFVLIRRLWRPRVSVVVTAT